MPLYHCYCPCLAWVANYKISERENKCINHKQIIVLSSCVFKMWDRNKWEYIEKRRPYSHLLLSLFMFMVDDEAATVVDESIVDCVASSAMPLSVLAFDTSIGNWRLDPVFALFASPRHWATCTNNNACDIVSKLSHRSHFNVSKPENSYHFIFAYWFKARRSD